MERFARVTILLFIAIFIAMVTTGFHNGQYPLAQLGIGIGLFFIGEVVLEGYGVAYGLVLKNRNIRECLERYSQTEWKKLIELFTVLSAYLFVALAMAVVAASCGNWLSVYIPGVTGFASGFYLGSTMFTARLILSIITRTPLLLVRWAFEPLNAGVSVP